MSSLNIRVPNVPDVGTRAKFKSVQSANPAANTEATITVPVDKFYKLISASISCVQGATQTPLLSLQIADASGNVVAQFAGASAGQTASTTAQWNWFNGAVQTAGAGVASNQGPIPPDVLIPPGYVVSTSTGGKGAATDLGVLNLFVTELRP